MVREKNIFFNGGRSMDKEKMKKSLGEFAYKVSDVL